MWAEQGQCSSVLPGRHLPGGWGASPAPQRASGIPEAPHPSPGNQAGLCCHQGPCGGSPSPAGLCSGGVTKSSGAGNQQHQREGPGPMSLQPREAVSLGTNQPSTSLHFCTHVQRGSKGCKDDSSRLTALPRPCSEWQAWCWGSPSKAVAVRILHQLPGVEKDPCLNRYGPAHGTPGSGGPPLSLLPDQHPTESSPIFRRPVGTEGVTERPSNPQGALRMFGLQTASVGGVSGLGARTPAAGRTRLLTVPGIQPTGEASVQPGIRVLGWLQQSTTMGSFLSVWRRRRRRGA